MHPDVQKTLEVLLKRKGLKYKRCFFSNQNLKAFALDTNIAEAYYPFSESETFTSNDFLLLEPESTKDTSKEKYEKLMNAFQQARVSFFIFYGDFAEPGLTLPFFRNYLLYSSDGHHIKNVYCSDDIGEIIQENKEASRFQPPFHRIFEAQAALNPQAIALTRKSERFSYQDLNISANKFAYYLLQQGLQHKSLVAIYLETSFECEIAILGVMKSGAAFLLADTHKEVLQRKAFYERLRLSGACALITTQAFYRELREIDATTHDKVDWEKLDIIDENTFSKMGDFSDQNPHTTSHPSDLAYVMYTSGSTGAPKDIKVSQVLAYPLAAHQLYTNATISMNIAKVASNSFDACLMERMIALATGATLHLFDRQDILSNDFGEALKNSQINIAIFTPALLSTLNPHDFPDLKIIFVVGDILDAKLAEKWDEAGKNVINGWGMNETAICGALGHFKKGEVVNIGYPIFGIDFRIQDGVLYVKGPIVSGEKEFCTEDLAEKSDDGRYSIKGRAGRRIKLRGQRIDLSEIEYPLRDQAIEEKGVRAVLRSSRNDKKELAIYLIPQDKTLIPKPEEPLSEEALKFITKMRSYLKETLSAPYKVPSIKNIILLEEFPRKGNDKRSIDDEALRKLANNELPDVTTVKPSSSEAIRDLYLQEIRKIIAAKIGIPERKLANDRNLHDFSLSSIDIIEIIKEIQVIKSKHEKYRAFTKTLTAASFADPCTIDHLFQNIRINAVKLSSNSINADLDAQRSENPLVRYLMENFGINGEGELVKNKVPCYFIPALFGDLDIDYGGTNLNKLTLALKELDTGSATDSALALTGESYVAHIAKNIAEQIIKENEDKPYIVLLTWSSGHLITNEVLKILRGKQKNIFAIVIDSLSPLHIDKINYDVRLMTMAENLRRILQSKFDDILDEKLFILPTQQDLNKISDKHEKVEFLFGFIQAQLKQMPTKKSEQEKAKWQKVKAMLRHAKNLCLAELEYSTNHVAFDFAENDLLIVAKTSADQYHSSTLGWNAAKEKVATVEDKDIDHFSLITSEKSPVTSLIEAHISAKISNADHSMVSTAHMSTMQKLGIRASQSCIALPFSLYPSLNRRPHESKSMDKNPVEFSTKPPNL